MEKSVTSIMGEVIRELSDSIGYHVNFMWGDWTYISNQLTLWGKNPETAQKKYPVVCLFSPFDEDRTDRRYASKVSIELLIATTTLSEYTNEQREEQSFEKTLRPIYRQFCKELLRCKYLDFDKEHIRHTYSENYRYGARGVMMSEGKRFNDLIDGIDIKRLELKIKNINCNGKRL